DLSLEDSCALTFKELEDLGGDGGLIAIDKNGKIHMPFNTPGMYRGSVSHNEELSIAIFK
ncbi:MAG: isoaspartyl peptidase/L-asparaginase, partial [Flavobacteriales bacterium]|nr:isoaspartyl peptidase/L-asparaginase [Flavobacteriales bacterium]